MLLLALVPLLDPLGNPGVPNKHTVLGYPYGLASVGAIVVSALLGVLVSLSTFLVIGATSSLTYNIVGHLKTIVILAGGCLLFSESMPPKRLAGISLTMLGIFWYTYLSVQQGASSQVRGARRPRPGRHAWPCRMRVGVGVVVVVVGARGSRASAGRALCCFPASCGLWVVMFWVEGGRHAYVRACARAGLPVLLNRRAWGMHTG